MPDAGDYRLFDRYGRPLASLAVLADDEPGRHPSGYQRELWGCRLAPEFPVVISLAPTPPVSPLCHPLNLQADHRTTHHALRTMYMDWVLALPETLEQQYLDEVYRLEEETHMRYVTSAERIGLKWGLEQGEGAQ